MKLEVSQMLEVFFTLVFMATVCGRLAYRRYSERSARRAYRAYYRWVHRRPNIVVTDGRVR